MPNDGVVRVEVQFREEDYLVLARVATARRTSVAALIRRTLYDHIGPLQALELERERKAVAEAREREALRVWEGRKSAE